MTQIYLIVCGTAFLALPVLAFALRAFGPRWFGAWTAIVVVGFAGWFLANACIYFSFEDACETMRAYGNNPPQEIADNCTVDGAARVFGVMFGWLYALIYYAPFALIYEVARWARRLYRKRREQDLVL